MAAMTALNTEYLLGAKLEISLAKPPSYIKRKEEMLRRREQRMMQVTTESVALSTRGPVHGSNDRWRAGTSVGMWRRGGVVAWTGWSSRSGSCIKRVERTSPKRRKARRWEIGKS